MRISLVLLFNVGFPYLPTWEVRTTNKELRERMDMGCNKGKATIEKKYAIEIITDRLAGSVHWKATGRIPSGKIRKFHKK